MDLRFGPAVLLIVTALAGCFPRQPGPHLTHFAGLAPKVGEPLPPIRILDLDGRESLLASVLAGEPAVLQLGSASCPVFRYRRHGIDRLARELGDRVRFVVLYTREAHPVGAPSPYTGAEWDPWINRVTGVRLSDTRTAEQRRRRAETVIKRWEPVPLVVVDPQGDPGWTALGRAPSAAFVLDRHGRVVARQVWVDPPALRRVLLELVRAKP